MGVTGATPQVGRLDVIRRGSVWLSEGILKMLFLPHFTNVLAPSVGDISGC